MSRIQLRDYQTRSQDQTRSALARVQVETRRPRVILQLATGGGKTAIASDMIRKAIRSGKTAAFGVHRRELIEQTSSTFEDLGIDHSFIAAGWPYDPAQPVQIASIDTLRARIGKRDYSAPDLLIIDEAHHSPAAGWQKVLEHWSSAYVVGLTATPERLDGRGLADLYDDMVTGPQVFELIDQGFLSEYEYLCPDIGLDLSQVRNVAGDFNAGELSEAMNDADLVGNIVRHWEQEAKGLVTLVFATRVDHSQAIVEAFNAAGHAAIHLDANTPTHERREGLRRLAEKRVQIVSNVGLFGEGFDLEANANYGRGDAPFLPVTVECVVLARPTQSLSIHLQQVGRALRPKENPAIILDHAGNLYRHGLPCAVREWTLDASKRAKGEAPVKTCPKCFAAAHANAQQCKRCGYSWPVSRGAGRSLVEEDGELVRVDVEAVREEQRKLQQRRDAEDRECRTFIELVSLAIDRGSKNPYAWADRRWRELGNVD